LRRKKDVLSEERSDEFHVFPENEKTSRNNPKSIYSDEGEKSRDSLDFFWGCVIIIEIVTQSAPGVKSSGRNSKIRGLHGEKSFSKLR
jgi:hypothetical protein